MKSSNRIMMAVAALLLISLYFLPIWSISLNAPQYPEGLGMNISINKIEGKEKGQLQSINGLNHYVGMKEIRPDSIPELKIMPWVIGVLVLLGLIAAVWGDYRWVLGWLILFIILAIVGLIDFYIWEYNYGHDLDPTAAIQVPGMTYQPPLIGSKKMLNITAVSLPHTGFYMALISMVLAAVTWFRERPQSDKSKEVENIADESELSREKTKSKV